MRNEGEEWEVKMQRGQKHSSGLQPLYTTNGITWVVILCNGNNHNFPTNLQNLEQNDKCICTNFIMLCGSNNYLLMQLASDVCECHYSTTQ